jgi:hypothetical protein
MLLLLQVGVRHALQLSSQHQLPWVPVHHMEAHALMAAMPGVLQQQQQQQPEVEAAAAAAAAAQPSMTFPALLLLASGGHNMLVGGVRADLCVVVLCVICFGSAGGASDAEPHHRGNCLVTQASKDPCSTFAALMPRLLLAYAKAEVARRAAAAAAAVGALRGCGAPHRAWHYHR